MLSPTKRAASKPKIRAKDPPVIVAEKFRAAMESESAEGAMYATLDLSATLSTPMQVIHSRNRIRKWIAFDRRVIQSCGAVLEYDRGENSTAITVDSESGKSVVSMYRIASLEFTDAFALNNVLMVRSVRRTMKRLPARSELERRQTDGLLLHWTGPHFVGFCTATATVGSRIDNRMVALPVLDFSFCQLSSVREMIEKPPRDGKEIRDKAVYLHYLAYAEAKARAELEQSKRQQDEESRSRGSAGRDNVIIKAKNRVGDEDHIVIDKNELLKGSKGNVALDARIELLEDAEAEIRDDKSRYACSGLKLNNNNIADAAPLELVCRLVIMNAFYFLSWVDLASNQITEVPDMSAFPIVSLYLHDNKIASLDKVKNLAHMKLLQNLTLFGNPIQSDLPAKYKLPVLSLLLVPDDAAMQRQEEERAKKRSEAGLLAKALRQIRMETMAPGKTRSAAAAAASPSSDNSRIGGQQEQPQRSQSRCGVGSESRIASRTPLPVAASPSISVRRTASPPPNATLSSALRSSSGNKDDSLVADEAAGAKHVIVSPTRLKYFAELPPQKAPPPPPQILRLRTLDHGLITPSDKTALTAWLDMRKPVKKNKDGI